MARKRKSKVGGLIIGPALIVMSVVVLWKNEGRFDYYKAARATQEINSPTAATTGSLVSYSNSMNRKLTMSGKYVTAFTGYLMVQRSAEIYAWDRDEDDDGHVTWSMRWMSSVENNNRNNGISQQLTSERFLPPEYRVGDMQIDASRIEFVDSLHTISPADLQLASPGQSLRLVPTGDYFQLYKNQGGNLGDERVGYSGIPVPEIAT